MRQIVNPKQFLNDYAALTPFGKRRMYRAIRKHQHENAGQPYVADLKSGLLIAETPIEIERLSCWLRGGRW
jgi:hypothetical protein